MVYLVDDDIDDLEIVQEALVQNDYAGPVVTLQNGKLLMDKLLEDVGSRPDVILLDLNMPLKDGFEVLREIKSHPLFYSIPVIVLTASANKADELRCLELGCTSFFIKPNSMQEYEALLSVVKRFVKP
jgi:CheY-like chemotaxis protein